MCNRAAIHFNVMVVSARTRIASLTFAGSHFRRSASCASCQPTSFKPARTNRSAFASALWAIRGGSGRSGRGQSRVQDFR